MNAWSVSFIMAQQADLYVNIIDAANLKRNLYLTLQLLEMGCSLHYCTEYDRHCQTARHSY